MGGGGGGGQNEQAETGGVMSRGKWLEAVSRHVRRTDASKYGGQGGEREVLAVALASYRRTALAHVGEERWGRWREDAWMARHVAVPAGVLKRVGHLRRVHLPGPYLSVHFRAGRILNRGTIDGGEGAGARNRFRRIGYQGTDLEAVLAYPVQCAMTLIERALEVMQQTGLQHVYFASDLVDGMMPELDPSNPATMPPLMHPDDRQRLLDNTQEAWQMLQDHLHPVVFSSLLSMRRDSERTRDVHARIRAFNVSVVDDEDGDEAFADKGLAAIIDRELLAQGHMFVYAGQYAGRCEATGYSEAVRERRSTLGMEEESSIYVTQCCITDSPSAYLVEEL